MQSIHHIKHHIKKTDIYLQYEHELYTINNMIRLTIVASSIAFFMILSLLDLAQAVVTSVYGFYYRINAWLRGSSSAAGSGSSEDMGTSGGLGMYMTPNEKRDATEEHR